jgi:hypothetical protein
MRFAAFALLALLFTAALPSVALAQLVYSYTLSVPVTAKNLPAGSTLNVGCLTYTGPNGAGQTGNLFSSSATPTNGSYSGSFSVPTTSKVPLTSYSCWVQVSVNGSVVNTQDVGHFNPPASPGWTGTMFASGNI